MGRDASTAGHGGGSRRRRGSVRSSVMLIIPADAATGQTLALIATFGGIGLFVNILIFYIIAQVLGERKENQEYHQGGGELR